MRSVPIALLICVLASAPAMAAATDWQELAPGVRLRLISADTLSPSGETMVGLELDMPQGYKTYWRVPGESGIPTQIDWSGSAGFKAARTFWPFPTIETVGDVTDFVYHGPTVLPVRLTLDGPRADLVATVIMGICSDVCVPAQARFMLPLDFQRPDRAQGLRLAQAMARAPVRWPGATSPFGTVQWDATTGDLHVTLVDPVVDPLSILVDARPTDAMFGAPQKSPEADLVILPLLGSAGDTDLAGAPVELTFLTSDGPFSVATRISAVSTWRAP